MNNNRSNSSNKSNHKEDDSAAAYDFDDIFKLSKKRPPPIPDDKDYIQSDPTTSRVTKGQMLEILVRQPESPLAMIRGFVAAQKRETSFNEIAGTSCLLHEFRKNVEWSTKTLQENKSRAEEYTPSNPLPKSSLKMLEEEENKSVVKTSDIKQDNFKQENPPQIRKSELGSVNKLSFIFDDEDEQNKSSLGQTRQTSANRRREKTSSSTTTKRSKNQQPQAGQAPKRRDHQSFGPQDVNAKKRLPLKRKRDQVVTDDSPPMKKRARKSPKRTKRAKIIIEVHKFKDGTYGHISQTQNDQNQDYQNVANKGHLLRNCLKKENILLELYKILHVLQIDGFVYDDRGFGHMKSSNHARQQIESLKRNQNEFLNKLKQNFEKHVLWQEIHAVVTLTHELIRKIVSPSKKPEQNYDFIKQIMSLLRRLTAIKSQSQSESKGRINCIQHLEVQILKSIIYCDYKYGGDQNQQRILTGIIAKYMLVCLQSDKLRQALQQLWKKLEPFKTAMTKSFQEIPISEKQVEKDKEAKIVPVDNHFNSKSITQLQQKIHQQIIELKISKKGDESLLNLLKTNKERIDGLLNVLNSVKDDFSLLDASQRRSKQQLKDLDNIKTYIHKVDMLQFADIQKLDIEGVLVRINE